MVYYHCICLTVPAWWAYALSAPSPVPFRTQVPQNFGARWTEQPSNVRAVCAPRRGTERATSLHYNTEKSRALHWLFLVHGSRSAGRTLSPTCV